MPVSAAGSPLVELEELTSLHASALFEGLSDARLYAFIDDEPPASVERLAERYRRLESRISPDGTEQWLNWAVRLRDCGAYAGYVQATISPGGEASVAYVIFAAHWGRGYGREAVGLMLGLLSSRHGVFRVSAQVDQRNARSTGLLRSLDFSLQKEVGVRDAIWAKDLQ